MSRSIFLLCCFGSLLLEAGPCVTAPPPVSHEESVHEATVNIEHRDKATMYTVTFAHLPLYVTGDDFDAHVIGNSVLKVIVGGTNNDWFFKLADPVPDDMTLKPPIEAERLEGDFTGAVWKVSVLVPKSYYPAARVSSGSVPGQKPPAGGPLSQLLPSFATPTVGGVTPELDSLGGAAPTPRIRRHPLPNTSAEYLYPPATYDG
ncbi:hypothetical protein TGPRC2_271220 [Toxoplasma gondii TgCatPRC2]|uniref:Uncharacterized protein n=13 Tax=Toxoplasma gondii TaxID=5811 RepID=B9PI47_TOXGV|nr:hypothetical protein TGME49_271220 [Toxoplasma gondii ME49]EPR64670.1 hypothetical protein TGGT1_271220 [Toxoplasma gondii GT1]ESS36179.1 hypothetical protein TGVEG_271220 [Toxoplasma gondii VEG]KAF4642207.1 hypothetical protein TGRH88_080200 [Toxoplasma gondii]KFG43483.1 hypothetical protein TGDOM2_271220 [Toxoplasma gondii GAB2-2007-GAL-DOM2]KFG52027.1 hypothetical protein TGP89_271220 [Toxoplasma gondii p89]KFG54286.1 hypothetical protein TGFOU_271220 [Toxoplasma gondii FOU]KFH16580.1 |eukprot:XP_002365788.1 hypothetical protein TGME49_271220 [Toxoplasma gondii ME49]